MSASRSTVQDLIDYAARRLVTKSFTRYPVHSISELNLAGVTIDDENQEEWRDCYLEREPCGFCGAEMVHPHPGLLEGSLRVLTVRVPHKGSSPHWPSMPIEDSNEPPALISLVFMTVEDYRHLPACYKVQVIWPSLCEACAHAVILTAFARVRRSIRSVLARTLGQQSSPRRPSVVRDVSAGPRLPVVLRRLIYAYLADGKVYWTCNDYGLHVVCNQWMITRDDKM